MILIKRKWISLLLAAVMCLGAAACREETETSSSETTVTHEDALKDAEILTVNSITGQPLAEGVEDGMRPVAVMVDNAAAALPQRGISSADAIVEMITEGGITRLMALYADVNSMPQVGPVRSARDQHLQFALPLNAFAVHIGTSVYANNLLNLYSYKTIDGWYLGSTAFWFDEARKRDQGRLEEHCWYTDAALVSAGIDAIGEERVGKGYTLFPFASSARTLDGLDAPDMSFSFSDKANVSFVYNTDDGRYYKSQNGSPHQDEANGVQLSFDNVLVLRAQVGLKEDAFCSDYDLNGGQGWYFAGGKCVELTWTKGAPESPLEFFTTDGQELEINPGKSYLAVIPEEQAQTLVVNAAAASSGDAAAQ